MFCFRDKLMDINYWKVKTRNKTLFSIAVSFLKTYSVKKEGNLNIYVYIYSSSVMIDGDSRNKSLSLSL